MFINNTEQWVTVLISCAGIFQATYGFKNHSVVT